MAGKTLSKIFCWEIGVGRLHILLASTDKGAVGVAPGLENKTDCVSFFRGLFPYGELLRAEPPNIPLAEAVKRALRGEPADPIRTDTRFTPFQDTVLQAITRIPFGKTATYGEVAAMIGNPRAYRAVGQVMGKNPLPLIYP